jgi:hypothetical protein
MPEEPIKTTTVIESPMIGFFHPRYTPDAPPYISIGSVVHRGTILCAIEAMKVYVEIPAGGTGTITEILVEDGQPVEFGQPLFHVKTDNPESFKNFPVVDVFEGIVDSEIDPPVRDQITRRFGG